MHIAWVLHQNAHYKLKNKVSLKKVHYFNMSVVNCLGAASIFKSSHSIFLTRTFIFNYMRGWIESHTPTFNEIKQLVIITMRIIVLQFKFSDYASKCWVNLHDSWTLHNEFEFLNFITQKKPRCTRIYRDVRGLETTQKTAMCEIRDKPNRDERGPPVLQEN